MIYEKKYFSQATTLIALIYCIPVSTMQSISSDYTPYYIDDTPRSNTFTPPSLQKLCLRSFPKNLLTHDLIQNQDVAPQHIRELLKKEHAFRQFRQFRAQYRTIDEALEKILQDNNRTLPIHKHLAFFELIQQFIYHGADLNMQDKKNQYTPLIMATYNDDCFTAELLINSNAALDEVDSTGSAALNIATAHASYPLIELLLSYKSDPNSLDFRGFSPLDWAVLNQREDVVPLLLKHRADPNRSNNTAERGHRNHHPSPLQYAVQYGNTAIMEMLLEAGASGLEVALEDAQNYEQEGAALLLKQYLR